MTALPEPRVAVQDAHGAAVAAQLLAGRSPDALVRLDRPGWARALAAAGADTPLAVVLGAGGDDPALVAALADTALTTVVVTGRHAAQAAAALLGGTATSHELADGAGVTVVRLAGGAPVPAAALAALVSRPDAAGRRRVTPPLPWRVAAAGPAGGAWVGPSLRRAPLPGTHPPDDPAGHADLLVLDATADVDGLRAAAAAAGVPSVGVPGPRSAAPPGVDHVLGDVADGPDAVRPVDPVAVGPRGWTRDPGRGWGLVTWYGSDPDAARAAHALVEGAEVTTVGLSGDVALDPEDLPAVCAVLADLRGVLDVPGLHASSAEHAHRLATWALAGVPVLVGELPREVRALLGDELTDALGAARRDELGDPDARERRAVLARRAAWRTHTPTARWRRLGARLGLPVPPPTTVSLLLATNRPDFVPHALEQVVAQTWPSTELVVALHGDAFGATTAADVRARVDGALPVTVLPVDAAASLGETLNIAAGVAGGTWLSKVDDDDWYSPDHVLDLLCAAEHSGADLVGKAAEFVHLAEADLTLRRFGQGQHTGSTTIAGGTLTLRRDVWRDVGGFAAVSHGEDRTLVHDVLAAGGEVHRTHGFGYLLHRHGRHAWEVDAGYFLDQAVATRPGLARAWSLT